MFGMFFPLSSLINPRGSSLPGVCGGPVTARVYWPLEAVRLRSLVPSGHLGGMLGLVDVFTSLMIVFAAYPVPLINYVTKHTPEPTPPAKTANPWNQRSYPAKNPRVFPH